MFKFIKEWYKDYNKAMKELNDGGWYVFYHSHGSVCHYVDPKLNTHINTDDDKPRTISKNNQKS